MDKLKIGRTGYKIVKVDTFPNSAVVAQIDYDQKIIKIAKRYGVSNKPRPQQKIEESFWHETVHGILKDMQSPLENNERFVDGFAIRLTKILKQVYPNESNVVTQRFKRIRKLPPQVLRNERIKKAQVSRDRADKIWQRTAQGRRTLRQRRPALRAV